MTQLRPVPAGTTMVTLTVAIGSGGDAIAVQIPASAGLVVPSGAPAPAPMMAMKSKSGGPPDSVAPITVIATARKHRGVPNLPLVPPDSPQLPKTFRLVSHSATECGETPDSGHDGGVNAEVEVLAPDRLRFNLEGIDLEGDLRNLDLVAIGKNGKRTTVPVDIHVCSDAIVLVDRSARMLEVATDGCCQTKWSSAVEAVNLFSALGALAVPDLAKATAELPEPNRVAIGAFFADEGAELTLTPLVPASEAPRLEAASPERYFASSLGAAVEQAAHVFPPSLLRRRHLIVITAGLDEADAAAFDEHVKNVPVPRTDPERGVHVHVVAFGRVGERDDARLLRLAQSHGGRYFNTAAAHDSLSSQALLPPLLSILQDLLPVQVIAPATQRKVVVEDGVSRVLFAGRATEGHEPLILENEGICTRPRRVGSDVGYAFSDTNLAVIGAWHVRGGDEGRPLIALAESSLELRCKVELDEASSTAVLSARVTNRGVPIRGAKVRVAVSQEGAPLGLKLTQFARAGGLAESLRRRTFDGRGLACIGPIPSLRRTLLDAFEASENQAYPARQTPVVLTETHGTYSATYPGIYPGVTEFRFRADGETDSQTSFSRTAEVTLLKPAVPDAGGSFVWFQPLESCVGKTTWLATFVPKVAASAEALRIGIGSGLAHEMGPGFAGEIGLAYAPFDGKPSSVIAVRDNWDGSYSAEVVSAGGEPPALHVTYRAPDTGALASVPVSQLPGTTRRVVVTLVGVLYNDEHADAVPSGATVVIAPNASFPRSSRRHIALPHLRPGVPLPVREVVFDQEVEDGASLFAALGDSSLDFFGVFEDAAGADRQLFDLSVQALESADGHTYGSWKAWYQVRVGELRPSVAPEAEPIERARDSA